MSDLKVSAILKLVDEYTAPAGKILGGNERLLKSLADTQKELKQLERSSDGIEAFIRLKRESVKTRQELDKAQDKVAALAREMKAAKKPSRELAQEFEQAKMSAAKLKQQHRAETQQLHRLRQALNKGGKSLWELTREQRQLEQQTRKTLSGLRAQERFLKSFKQHTKQAGAHVRHIGNYAAKTGVGLVGLGYLFKRTFIDTASEFEQYEAILKNAENSREKAKASLQWASDFAAKTPFQLGQVTRAFVRLRAYGLDPTNGLLKTLGDTAAGMGVDIMQAVEAIADAVTGENERLREFGITARADRDQFIYEYTKDGETKTLSALKSDRAEIERVLRSIMDERFSGAMEEQRETFIGIMSELSDSWTRTMNVIMDKGGVLKWIKAQLGGVIDELKQIADNEKLAAQAGREIKEVLSAIWSTLKGLWSLLKGLAALMKPVAELLGGWSRLFAIFLALPIAGSLLGLITTIAALTASLKLLGLSFTIAFWPVAAIIAAVATLGYAGYKLIKYWGAVKRFFSGMGNTFLVLLGPIGGLIYAGKALYSGWEAVAGLLSSVWTGLFDAAKNIWDTITGYILLKVKAILDIGGKIGRFLQSLFGKEAQSLKMATEIHRQTADVIPITRAVKDLPSALPADGNSALKPTPVLGRRSWSSREARPVIYEGAQITVHAAPGMNEAKLAELVARQQDEAQRRTKRRARGRMHDGIGGAY